MNWFSLDKFPKRFITCLLKNYFGKYLVHFDFEKLSCKLKHGKGSVENVEFRVEALNELSEKNNFPFEFLHASVDDITILIPWTRFLCEPINFEITGLRFVVQPKERAEDVSMFESMWGSMTSSLQLAEECMNTKPDDEDEYEEYDKAKSYTSEGVLKIAKAIDFVFANMNVKFHNCSLKIEHVPRNGSSGVSLEIKIANAEYFDEAASNSSKSDSNSGSENQAYSFKKIIFEGVSLFTAQFSCQSRAFSTKIISTSDCMEPSGFVPGSPEMPPTHSSLPMKKFEPEFHEDPIVISKLHGKQELRIKLKQTDTIIGPKVDVELNLGSLNLLLTPQQYHMLCELFSGLMKPSSNNDHNNMPFCVTNKPMRPADYALVEQELLRHQQKSHTHSRSLKNQQGWSSHSLAESDEDFQPMAMENRLGSDFHTSTFNDNDSLCSSISSDTRSDSAGHLYGGNQKSSRHKGSTVKAMLSDQLTELTHFRGCCSSLLIIILHDDSVQESLSKNSSDTSKHNCRKFFSLKERAEKFFSDLLALQQSGVDFKNFASMREPLSELCDTNHLRLFASSVSIDGNQKSSSAQCIMNFTLSLFKFEVLECLFNSANPGDKPQTPTYVEVLSCDNKVNVDETNVALKEACFKLKYKQIEYTTQNRLIKPPANTLDIQFGHLTCELDISLIDRIQTLLNFENLFGQKDTKTDDWAYSEVNVTRCSPNTEVTISCPTLIVNLRFPIPDLRSVHEMDRVPWWQQNLHPEVLIMEARDVTFITLLNEDMLQSKYEIQCRDLHGLFKHSTADEPISFLRVSVDPDVDEISQNNGFDWPRLVIHTTTKVSGGDLETGLEEHEDLFCHSLSDVLMSNMNTEPSPFRSSSEVRGTRLEVRDNNVEKEEQTNMSVDHDEVIKPADKVTINNFIEQTVSKSECLLEFSLPTANVILPSKEFFEMLYNRLGSDLLLWQRTTLAPMAPYEASGFKVHIPGLDLNTHMSNDQGFENFSVFRPFSNDSNSDSEEEEANFCSVYEYCQRERQKHKRIDVNNAFTKLSITVAVTKGNLTFHTPTMDSSNKVLPDVCGKLQLQVEDGQIFIASSYKGDKNESYLCVLAEKSTLYHNGTAVKQVNCPVVETLRGDKPTGLNRIIYESEQGMRLKSFACDTSKISDMLKIAVHIVNSPKQLLKSFKVAIDISDATLRHYMHSSPEMWVNQLIDFLKVRDFPVNGYTPSDVVTEFHLNLSNCAIDYRPLHLPILCAITVENFNMSCNISATTPSFLFRIISDKMRLFVSNNIAAKKVELRRNYVCVIDSGLIDVSSRTSRDEKNEEKQEIYATNNMVHIRTCADSFKALIDLMIYVSANGDKIADDLPEAEVKKDVKKPPTNDIDTKLHLMMAEAMKDCSKNNNSDDCIKNGDNTVTEYDMLVNTDDEFCIIEDDPGVGLKPRNGEPQIRILTDKPIQIVEDHFSVPPGKSDVLKAPSYFPPPVFSFALREMSLIWHVYGGSDFKLNSAKKKSKRNKEKNLGVTFSDLKKVEADTNNYSLSFCKVTPLTKNVGLPYLKYSMETVIVDETKESDSWLHQGGLNRNQDVLMELEMRKIRFQRDVFAPDKNYASRYILLIYEIEILDRLKSSNINKFLHPYSSQKIPRQSNANMVDINASYARPDPSLDSEECSLRVSCTPLKLNIDQDSLVFLVAYFREVMGITEDNCEETDGKEANEKNSVVTSYQVRDTPPSDSSSETFYTNFTFQPDLLIRIDYQGKFVDMEQGAVKGLLLGLTKLHASEIKLKHIYYRHGLLGHHKVLSYALNEWKQDILRNQLQSIVGGVGAIGSFVQLFYGVKDLFVMPVAQYQKDGQIIRGLQRGAASFSTSALVAALDLFSGLIFTIQGAAIFSHDMVTPGPSVANKFHRNQETYRQTSQPRDINDGIKSALNVCKEGIDNAVCTIKNKTIIESEEKGITSAAYKTVLQFPAALALNTAAVGSEVVGCLVQGFINQLRPDSHQEDNQKWKMKNS